MNRCLALPSADLQSTGRWWGGIYITATINKNMYPLAGGRIQPVWGSQGWLHRRSDVFTSVEEVVRSCGAKGQEQNRQKETQIKQSEEGTFKQLQKVWKRMV